MAGAVCAQALAQAGHAVQVFDKSSGPGGRLATRRFEWLEAVDGQALQRTTPLDHGAIAFKAQCPGFQAFIHHAKQAGCVSDWVPVLAPGSRPVAIGQRLVPTPDLPALCRHLLQGVSASWSFAVDALQKGPLGWQLQAAGGRQSGWFDAVVLALPPAQAAPLLGRHRVDWARHTSVAPMQPCWTLMGMAAAHGPAPAWDLAQPPSGPIAWVLRPDARPGREPVPGHAQWVVHARSGWSRRYLEETPAWVQAQLQAALDAWLGRAVDWRHAAVHRWRYALPLVRPESQAPRHWWDAAQGLGVCGDWLGGGCCGVEGAWWSGHTLASAALESVAAQAAAAEPATARPAPRNLAAASALLSNAALSANAALSSRLLLPREAA
ncbi:MAG: NAD(P)-binding protein [Rubrivivax sp.]|nr:NAD(P)-binding protein [Rubrivivax sp.]